MLHKEESVLVEFDNVIEPLLVKFQPILSGVALDIFVLSALLSASSDFMPSAVNSLSASISKSESLAGRATDEEPRRISNLQLPPGIPRNTRFSL